MKTTRHLQATLAALVAASSLGAAAEVTSVANGNYNDGTTWSDGNPPSAVNDYVILNSVEQSGDATTALAGNSVTINAGVLRLTSVDNSPDTFIINNLTLNGGRFDVRSSNQYARTVLIPNEITVASDSEFRIGDGGEAFFMEVQFNGGLTGNGSLDFIGNGGNGADDEIRLHATSADSTFSGNWRVDSIDSGQAILVAEAANALGSGSVTLETRGQLRVASANALDSVLGVTLTEPSSVLTLTNAWTTAIGTLDVQDGTVDLADSASSVSQMTIAGNNVPVGGPYTATDLTNLGFGGTFTGATGTLEVTGLPSPALVLQSDIQLENHGYTESYSIPVSNFSGDGTTVLNISAVNFVGADAAGVSNVVFPATVAAGATENITFDYTPAGGAGDDEIDFEIVSDDAVAASPQLVPVTMEVLPSPVLTIGSTFFESNGDTQTFQIPISNQANDGTTALTLSDVTFLGGALSGDVSNVVFPASVAAGASDFISFDFNPTFGPGGYPYQFTVESNDELNPSLTFPVTLQVDPNPVLVVDAAIELENNGLAANYSVPISNSATKVLSISGVVVTGPDSGYVSNLAFPASVAGESADEITFDFDPTDGPGPYTFDLEITSDDQSASSPRVVTVTIDVEDPDLSVDTAPIDFGSFASAPAPMTATISITNVGGTENLIIDDLLTEVLGSSAFSVTTFPGPIAPGASGDLVVTFDAGSEAGFLNGTLVIVSNDSNFDEPEIELSAFVEPSQPRAAIDFGTSGSPVASGYSQFVASEGASKTIGGVTVTIESRDTNIFGTTGAQADPLFTDAAQTPFNGSGGNYISVLLSGFNDGTLNLISYHDYPSGLGLPLDILFGEQGGTLTPIANGISRPATASYSTPVTSGTTYELRVREDGNANLAYISGLLMWGDAVPGSFGYEGFVTDAGLDPETTGAPELDPDFDGVETGIEWVVGGSANDPANPDTGKLPTGTFVADADPDGDFIEADYLLFSYRRTDAANEDPGTVIAADYGSDLSGWITATDGVDGVVILETDDIEPGVDQVNVYIPTTLAVGGKLFGRLVVTFPEP